MGSRRWLRLLARFCGLIVVIVVLYEAAANLKLRAVLRELRKGEPTFGFETAYTVVPGEVVIARLRIHRAVAPTWVFAADRVDLQLRLRELIHARLHVSEIRLKHARLDIPAGDRFSVGSEHPSEPRSLEAPPILQIAGAKFEFEPGYAVPPNIPPFDLVLDAKIEHVRFRTAERSVGAPVTATFALRRASSAWTIEAGTFVLPGLDVESSSSAATSSHPTLRVNALSGTLSGPAPVLRGMLKISGRELKDLLGLIGMPESVNWMLSRFEHQQFELNSDVQLTVDGLAARALSLSCGDLRMEGALFLTQVARTGALLVDVAPMTIGIRFDRTSSHVSWSPDRAWLQTQIEGISKDRRRSNARVEADGS